MTKHSSKPKELSEVQGRLLHVIYSPKGSIEGALIESNEAHAQLVLDHGDEASALLLLPLKAGQSIKARVKGKIEPRKDSASHPVYELEALAEVDGKRPSPPDSTSAPSYQGRVARLNYARHGAPNGVVLDTGDFIHVKPDGMARLQLKVGDEVQVDGDAQRLIDDAGWAVEAEVVNGQAVKMKPR